MACLYARKASAAWSSSDIGGAVIFSNRFNVNGSVRYFSVAIRLELTVFLLFSGEADATGLVVGEPISYSPISNMFKLL
jgi:hypothetical protein